MSFSNPTLINVTITENREAFYGGGIYSYYSNPTLTNVTISHNKAEHGCGMYSFESNPVLTDVIISNNQTEFIWNGRDSHGFKVSNGVYFCRLSLNGKYYWTKLAVVN